ncbi:MAG: domain S-box/diguanylate cyclase protein [Firmicutes bacterium]|nr:domain S-box/diguanylate cyclase protein [Bacillota bacterium]
MGYFGVIAMSELLSAQLSSQKRNDLLKQVINSMTEAMFFKGPNGQYLGCNQEYEKMLGRPEAEIIGKTAADFYDAEQADFMFSGDQLILSGGKPIKVEIWLNNADDTAALFEITKSPLFDVDGQIIGILGVLRDITKQKEADEQVRDLSYRDHLTGLYNRRFLEEEIRRLDTERNQPVSIIMGDLNQLKLINDAFGHDKGDELIRKAAQLIQKCCRTDDLVSRWGGDEFIVYLPKTKTQEAQAIVDRILEQCAQENILGFEISISFGVATQLSEGKDVTETIRKAEEAMYQKKAADRKSTRDNILHTITTTLYRREPEEEAHANEVSSLCRKTAIALGLSAEDVNKLALGGLMHDIGKIAISASVLDKPTRLTAEDWAQIRQHPEIGYRVVSSVQDMVEVGEAILAHHEKWNGTGYPRGSKWEDIPLFARVVALAESYATMIKQHPYRPGLSREAAIAEIRKNEGSQYDPAIAEIFIEKVVNEEEQT